MPRHVDPAAGRTERRGEAPARWPHAPAGAPARPSSRALLPRYDAYRRYQARELLSLLPPEGLRALYRAARDAHNGAGVDDVADPMAVLNEFLVGLLPLPPFHVWYQDLHRNPQAHLDAPWMAEAYSDRGAPFTLDVRVEVLQGEPWRAELRVHRRGDHWRGHLCFSREGEDAWWRTADVFREPDAESLLNRFREFDRVSLEAFLRSVLP